MEPAGQISARSDRFPPARSGGEGSPAPASVTVRLGWWLLLLQLALSPLIFSQQTVDAFEFPKVALLQLVAIALTALGLAALVGRLAGALSRLGQDSILEQAR